MILATATIAFLWIIILTILASIGYCIVKGFRLSFTGLDLFFGSVWTGWVFVIAFLQFWHLIYRIDEAALTVIAIFGFICMVSIARYHSSLILRNRRISLKHGIATIIIVFGIILIANRNLGPLDSYDAGLYHLNAIKWAKSYPIIPGIGSLHGRLAFNSSYFLYLGVLDSLPLAVRSYHLAGGLLLLVLTGQLVSGLPSPSSLRTNSISFQNAYSVILLFPVLVLLYRYPTTSTDLPILIVGVISSLYLGKLIFSQPSRSRAFGFIFIIAILSAVGITIKLSYVILGGLNIVIAIGYYFWRFRCVLYLNTIRNYIGEIIIPLTAAIVIVAPWIIRGYILSGYPFFPMSIGSLPFDWKVPEAIAYENARAIRSWARWPGMSHDVVLGSWRWLGPWFSAVSADLFRFDIPVALVLSGVAGIVIVRRRIDKPHRLKIVLFLIPAIASLLYWFIFAPDLRFLGAPIYIIGAGLIASTICVVQGRIMKIVVYFFISICLIWALLGVISRFADPIKDYIQPPPTSLVVKSTLSSQAIYTPLRGDQCWDSPLPCTPYFNPNLRLRRQGDLSSGFKFGADEH